MGGTFLVLLLAILVTASSAISEFSTSCYKKITANETPISVFTMCRYSTGTPDTWTFKVKRTTEGLEFSVIPKYNQPAYICESPTGRTILPMSKFIISAPKSSTEGCEAAHMRVTFDVRFPISLSAYIFKYSTPDEEHSEAMQVELFSEKQILDIKNENTYTSDLLWLSQMVEGGQFVRKPDDEIDFFTRRARPVIVREDLLDLIASVNTT